MEKYRKVFFEIEKALSVDAYSVIILLGLRKTGKTTILKQLAKNHNGCYLDFRDSKDPDADYLDIYERKEKLILLDEIGYLPLFDAYFNNLERDIASVHKKIVITSSSYGSLKQLAAERLGGGRSYPVELFPLSFEEYLYFAGRIERYGDDYEPSENDLQDFYRLKNLPEGMGFIVDREYLLTVFSDAEVARANHQHAARDIFLEDKHYASVLDVLAYTLNTRISLNRFKGMRVGVQELGTNVKGIPISKSLISLANNIVNKMTNDLFPDIGIKDLAHIVSYLYHSGFLFIDLDRNEKGIQSIDNVKHDLALVGSLNDFERVLNTYTLSVISPLLYTRLMIDIEDIAEKLCTGSVFGELYELTVKSESVYKNGYDRMHRSFKYKADEIEVDLWQHNLLFEATIRDKGYEEHSVDKVAIDYPVIRILTCKSKSYKFNGIFYHIWYPIALLMLSNDTIFDLNPTAPENNEMKYFRNVDDDKYSHL